MTLKIAIVGCGAVAQRLYRKPLQLLEKRGLVRIVMLVDPVADHARELGAYFPGATHHASLDDALAAFQPDLTLVLSPAHLHCAQAVAAMQKGSHVLCEKPMASTESECIRMNDVAAETRRVLAIGMIRRFFPAVAQLRNVVASGQLGKLLSFEYREGHKFEWDVTTPAAFKPRSQGGAGVLFDIGPHAVDVLAWILGDLQVQSYADDALAGIESNLRMELLSGHCPGTLQLSWDFPLVNELRVKGDRAEAVLRIDRFDQLAVGRPGQFVPVPIDISFPADASSSASTRLVPRSYAEAIFGQLVQTVRAILLGEPPAVDGQNGRACIAVLESGLKMAHSLPSPWLEPHEREAMARMHWRAAK